MTVAVLLCRLLRPVARSSTYTRGPSARLFSWKAKSGTIKLETQLFRLLSRSPKEAVLVSKGSQFIRWNSGEQKPANEPEKKL